jgi:hypothetical protein
LNVHKHDGSSVTHGRPSSSCRRLLVMFVPFEVARQRVGLVMKSHHARIPEMIVCALRAPISEGIKYKAPRRR